MVAVNRALKRRLALGVAIAALVIGGAVAAMAATSGSGHHHARTPGTPVDLPVAASYLGVSPTQLEAQLRAGKTLADVAKTTPGKSEAGLVAAIVSARESRLSAIAAKLSKHVKAEVNRTHNRQGLGAIVRSYLGLTQAQIHRQLRAGKTLAQIADATPGKSAAGLSAALLQARRSRLEAMVKAGKITQAQFETRTKTLPSSIASLLNRVRRPHSHRAH
jgi:hypothetical protein